MVSAKRVIKQLASRAGLDIRLVRPNDVERREPQRADGLGTDPYADMKRFLASVPEPLILDVGANVGQSAERFKSAFPRSVVHCFEPSPTTCETLRRNCEGMPGVSAWNVALGARSGETKLLLENSADDMSSLLAPGSMAWGSVTKKTEVEVLTVDQFAADRDIPYVHVLKSDTQGYDLEVLRGADRMMREHRIALVYFEWNFGKMYEGLPPFHAVCEYLQERDFALVSWYDSFYQQDLMSWADMMFIDRRFHAQYLAATR